MSDTDFETIDRESLEELFEPTVEIPAALLLAAGGCCCAWTGAPKGSIEISCC